MRTMKPHADGHQARNGQVLIVAAVGLVVLGVVAALAVDVGYLYCARARLQNAADAATLAAAEKLVEERNAGAAESAARSAAATEAQAIVAANWAQAGWQVAFGTFEGGTFVQQGEGTAATAVRVVAHRKSDAPGGALSLFFAPLAGIQTVEVSAPAVSRFSTDVGTIRNSMDLVPFAVYKDDVVAPGQVMTVYDHGQVAPGNFGLLNFDGGSLGTPELWDWILNGYRGEVTIDPATGCTWFTGECGFRAAIKSAVQERMGDLVIVCVYDQVTGQGSNANFRIIRFLAVTLTECKLTGKDPYIKARVEQMVNVPDGESGGPPNGNLCVIKLVQ